MESHKTDEDNDEDSTKTDWLDIFIVFRSRGFSDEEILQLSYPKFKAYLKRINNPLFFPIAVPYMGSGEKEEGGKSEGSNIKNGQKIASQEELLSIVASMNQGF